MSKEHQEQALHDDTAIQAVADQNEKVKRLEALLLGQPQVNFKTTHVINGGMYARTIVIPAGAVLTGAAHKTDHINIVQGDITVTTDEGPRRITGHHVIATKAGMKRAGVAHAETIWTTVCKTSQTELHAIEAELVEAPETLQTRAQEIEAAHLQTIKE